MSIDSKKIIAQLPDIPQDEEGPVFAEPWQAQIFAVTLNMHERGAFSWPDWAQYLSAELKQAEKEGCKVAENYYLHWLSALETMLDDKGIVRTSERETCKGAWDKAARKTPHGQPIILETTV